MELEAVLWGEVHTVIDSLQTAGTANRTYDNVSTIQLRACPCFLDTRVSYLNRKKLHSLWVAMILPSSLQLTLVFSLSSFWNVRLKCGVPLGPGQAKLLLLEAGQDQLCQGFDEDNTRFQLSFLHNAWYGERAELQLKADNSFHFLRKESIFQLITICSLARCMSLLFLFSWKLLSLLIQRNKSL